MRGRNRPQQSVGFSRGATNLGLYLQSHRPGRYPAYLRAGNFHTAFAPFEVVHNPHTESAHRVIEVSRGGVDSVHNPFLSALTLL